jgi:hypothetical protein
METIKTTDAFKKGLVELDGKVAAASREFELFLRAGAMALGVPNGWALNRQTMDFDPPIAKPEAAKV